MNDLPTLRPADPTGARAADVHGGRPAAAARRRGEVTFRWAPWWVLAFVALWPLNGPAEAVLSLGALLALVLLLVRRFRHGERLMSNEAWALTTVLFLSYWLPELFSSVDAVDRARALKESAVDLRYLPFLWLVAMAVADARGRRLTFGGLAAIAALWTLDGAVQALAGTSPAFWSLDAAKRLLGDGSLCPIAEADRLSGAFGPCNLKLGLVLASLAPFPLAFAARRLGGLGWAAAAVTLAGVVFLAGSRASWITLALVLAITGWQVLGRRRALLLATLGALAALVLLVGFADRLGPRFERTQALLSGDSDGMDYALSGRLPIWHTALAMVRAHPVNGVGVRGFREAYPAYAQPGDRWMQGGNDGAFHAHQIVLEVLSETGLLGGLLWLAGAALALRAWRYASPAARLRARTPALALLVTVFPLNTHLAFYSTFWGGLSLLLAALYAGALLARDDEPVPAAA